MHRLALLFIVNSSKRSDQQQKENDMTNVNELTIKNVDYSLEHGFFWVEFDNGNSLQCCLKAARQTEQELYEDGVTYLEQIDGEDSGFYEGLSYDCNAWAADENGELEHAEEFLLEQARKAGIEIVA